MPENRRLDRVLKLPVVEWLGALPRLTTIRCPFHVDAPTLVLGRAAAKQPAVGQQDRLVLDRTGNAVRQPLGLRPCAAGVVGTDQHSPPGAGTGTDLVEEQQRSV